MAEPSEEPAWRRGHAPVFEHGFRRAIFFEIAPQKGLQTPSFSAFSGANIHFGFVNQFERMDLIDF